MDHFKCREKVCAACFCLKGRKASFLINQNQELELRKCIPEYDSSNPEYPVGLCNPCRIILNSQKGNINNKRKMKFTDYEPVKNQNMIKMTVTDDDEATICTCKICHVAKLYGTGFMEYYKQPNLKKCDVCNSEIARGSNHSTTKCNQLKLQNLSEREKEIVAYEFLKSSGAATVKLSGSHGGNKLQVAVGSQGCIT